MAVKVDIYKKVITYGSETPMQVYTELILMFTEPEMTQYPFPLDIINDKIVLARDWSMITWQKKSTELDYNGEEKNYSIN